MTKFKDILTEETVTKSEAYLKLIGKENLIKKIKKVDNDVSKVIEKILDKHKGNTIAGMEEVTQWVEQNMPDVIKKVKGFGLSDDEFDKMMSFKN